jgi:uncharacterized RDD family membrane protein YckC
MKWYYAVGSNQMGPVSDAELGELARAGKIQAGTLVWHAGQEGWLPYSQIAAGAGLPQPAAPAPPPAPAPAAPAAPASSYAAAPAAPAAAAPAPMAVAGATAFCAACGQQFAQEDMIHYMGSMICMGCKPAYFQRMREGAAAPGGSVSGNMEYAGFWIRFVAKIIDGLIVGIPLFIIVFVIAIILGIASGATHSNVPNFAGTGLQIVAQFFFTFAGAFYSGFMNSRYGATLGKMAVGIKVVTLDGQNPSFGRAFGRGCAEFISGLCCDLGYILAAFDSEKRTAHDHICGTRVVKK